MSLARNIFGLLVAILAISVIILVIENPFRAVDIHNDGRPMGIEEGWQAPSFSLETLDGVEVTLSDLRGKVVVLNFWATWCSFCVNEMSAFQELYDEMSNEVVIVGVNRAESVGKQRNFLDNQLETRITYLLLKDSDDSIAEIYGVTVMPTTFFLDENGIIVEKRLGEMTLREMKAITEDAMNQI